MTWRQRVALWVLGRLWPSALEDLVTAWVERADRAPHVGEVTIASSDLARLEGVLRSGHRALFPRAVRHGKSAAELVSDIRLAKVMREVGDDPCHANP